MLIRMNIKACAPSISIWLTLDRWRPPGALYWLLISCPCQVLFFVPASSSSWIVIIINITLRARQFFWKKITIKNDQIIQFQLPKNFLMKQWINNIGGRQVSHSISGMRHSKKQQQQHTRQNKKKKKKTSGLVIISCQRNIKVVVI